MPRPKKIGGFTASFNEKKPAMAPDKWSPKSSAAPDPEAADEAARQGKYDLEKLLDAEDIRSNPDKMKHAMAHADEKMGKIRSIQDLKDVAEAKFGSGRKK